MTEEKKQAGIGKFLKLGCFGIVGIFILLIVIGIVAGEPSKKTGGKDESNAAPATAPTESPATASEPPAVSSLTGPQQNAVRSAEQYLSMSGFSHDGLVGQLSSDAGDGYSVSDATAAVDSLTVDWNEQAARSAKQYLSMSGFSCKGLIQQLSSKAGDKYTESEASYGAKQAGAC